MLKYKDIRFEYDLTATGNPWGESMAWLFAICDELHFNRDSRLIPAEWEFMPSPIATGPEPDTYEADICGETETEALLEFGRTLNRHIDWCRHAGINY